MKKALKKILKLFGLFEYTQKIVLGYRQRRKRKALKKYTNTKKWNLNFDKLNLFFSTEDWYSKEWFFPRYDNGKIHEPITTKVFIDHIEENSTVLDVGAHIGYFSCIAGQLARNGKVYVFEVDPQCLALIRKNLQLNNLKNVVVNNLAVSDNNESVQIPLLANPNPGLVINSQSDWQYLEVASTTIDEFIAANGISPDFVKIDVEGAEWNVLKGMQGLLKNHEIKLLIEIHVNKLKKYFDTDYKLIIEFLLDAGFTLENIESHRLEESAFVKIDKHTSLQENTMVLCTKNPAIK